MKNFFLSDNFPPEPNAPASRKYEHCREWVRKGVAVNGYVYRLVKHNEGEYSDGKGNHIDGLEGFWGYLKRRLAAKGGIRKERLPLYLAEYVWKYNHGNDSIGSQKNLFFNNLKGVMVSCSFTTLPFFNLVRIL